MRAPQVFIETFGCQMNEYDTELVRSILKARGYGFTDSADTADVVLLNTCAIRENAHNKVYGRLGLLKPLKAARGLVIGVLGCMAQNLKKDLLASDALIDVLVGPASYRALPALRGAVADIRGIARARFTAPHPKDFPDNLLAPVTGHPKICEHTRLPLQAGNDRILQLMNRTYTRAEYLALVARIRRRCPDIVLTTDIIAGFCSETEAEFAETYDLVQRVGYHSAYIFKYSERKNTIAARKFADDVPDAIKAERVSRLVELQRGISLKKNRALIGKTVEVLVEGDGKHTDQWKARTDGNIVTVIPKTAGGIKPGSLVPIRITDATVTTLYAQPA